MLKLNIPCHLANSNCIAIVKPGSVDPDYSLLLISRNQCRNSWVILGPVVPWQILRYSYVLLTSYGLSRPFLKVISSPKDLIRYQWNEISSIDKRSHKDTLYHTRLSSSHNRSRRIDLNLATLYLIQIERGLEVQELPSSSDLHIGKPSRSISRVPLNINLRPCVSTIKGHIDSLDYLTSYIGVILGVSPSESPSSNYSTLAESTDSTSSHSSHHINNYCG